MLQVVYDTDLDFEMRSYFIRLANSMYLDREPLEPLQMPQLTLVLNEVPGLLTGAIQTSRVRVPGQMVQYKRFILNFLQKERGVQSVSEKPKNKFILQVLKSLYFMVTHGFYKDQQELNELALPLISLLDGTNDVYSEQMPQTEENDNNNERYKYSKENELILMSKKIQCDCLIFIS